MAHDAVQVHQHLSAQDRVQLALARAVDAHQALQGGGLVGAVVVDVQVRWRASRSMTRSTNDSNARFSAAASCAHDAR